MHLTPKEIDKLMLLSLGMVAERRMKKGLKLNYPEAVAYITSTALEGAREGKTVEEVMKGAASVLKKSDVMEGVADMIDLLQVEAVFTDGSRLRASTILLSNFKHPEYEYEKSRPCEKSGAGGESLSE